MSSPSVPALGTVHVNPAISTSLSSQPWTFKDSMVSSGSVIGTRGSWYFNCLMYQSVLSRLRLITRTSLRMPSTSCRNQRVKVSLSPLVKMRPFSSHDCSMLYA